MKIVKIGGDKANFMPNKILKRIKAQAKGLEVNSDLLFQKVIPHIVDGITTTEIDEIIAFKAADMQMIHPDYSILGGRILMTRQSKLIGVDLQEVDLTFDFFSASTFLAKYSKKNKNKEPLEIPSMMQKRVCKHLFSEDKKWYNRTLNSLKNKRINFATPVYTNSGIPNRNSLISCNLTSLYEDSREGIQATLDRLSSGSKEGAGIGLQLDRLRSEESMVSSFNNNAGGVVGIARMVQSTMQFYKQGERSGSCAMYLSTWHRDVMKFLSLTLPIGDEKLRTRDLFSAIIIDDVFMDCLINKKDYYTFCPNDIKKAGLKALYECSNDEFRQVYNKAVKLGLGKKISPKKLWDSIINSQVQSGKPYIFYKDNANIRNMQDNIGVVNMSNLCIEIVQVSKPGYTPQCALSSINLAEQTGIASIKESAKILTRALNRIVDINKWSDDWSANAGIDQRAIAIGVAGMADFFAKRKISFESQEAKDWTEKIFSTIYKAAVEESMQIAIEKGENYPAYSGSRYEKGETYIEGWSPLENGKPIPMYNSLLLGLMPTASSAILLGVFESFQPVDSNFFTRRVGGGEFMVVNKYLISELIELGLWNQSLRDKIIQNQGSIQGIDEIPSDLQYRYKTVWEIPQKTLIDLAIIRNKYVDQSQSMNLYFPDSSYKKISSAQVYAWKNGLKTGVYYTRTKSKQKANTKLASSEIKKNVKPNNSLFTCAGGGCSA